ncbi:MAG: FAD-dependent oxidoreductase [Acidobacteria bacterium]|nr:MAG: FAD-dependent oxidoreductase [Acidobacteriota bacterium]
MSGAERSPAVPAGGTAVVGGGMLGIGAALLLAEAGRRVTLFERADCLGGLAAAWSLGPVRWDRHYHVILESDEETLGLLEKLDLAGRVVWSRPGTGCFAGGRLFPVTSAADMLRLPALGLVDKFRLGLTVLRAAHGGRRGLDEMTAERWLVRWSGKRAYTAFWKPLLVAKLGASHGRASAAFIQATIRRLYTARRGASKRERFGYVRGGYAVVLDRAERALRDRGCTLRLGAGVSSIVREGSRVAVAVGDRVDLFDDVILTLPPPIAARLCPQLDHDTRKKLESIEYIGVICASLLLDRALSGYYVTNVLDEGLPFTAVIEMTACVDPGDLRGRHLIYLPRYAPWDDPFWDLDDSAIRESLLAGLERVHPGLGGARIEAFRVSRQRFVLPLPAPGLARRVPGIEPAIPGIWMLSSAQIRDGTPNVNDTLRLARQGVAALLGAVS